MATNTNIKNALSFPASANNVLITDGRTVGNAELTRIQDWLDAEYATQLVVLGKANVDADDMAAVLWRVIANQVKRHEKQVAKAALAPPAELSE